MYFLLFLFILLSNSINSTLYAIGTHNFIFTAGGESSVARVPGYLASSALGPYVDMPSFSMYGGGFRFELGYLFHHVTSKNIVHGIDMRASFMMHWQKGKVIQRPQGKVNQNTQSIGHNLTMTYTLGKQTKSGHRIMFDIIGFGYSIQNYDVYRTVSYTDFSPSQSKNWGSKFIVGYDFVIPGFHLITKNGFTFGFRTLLRSNIVLKEPLPNMNLLNSLYFGYTFG